MGFTTGSTPAPCRDRATLHRLLEAGGPHYSCPGGRESPAARPTSTRQDVVTSLDNYSLDDRYINDEGRVFLTGIQALARAPMGAVSESTPPTVSTRPRSCPVTRGSPLGGFDQEMARAIKRVGDLNIVCKPGVNEELAATAVMGSQVAPTLDGSRYDGVIGYWYGKAPGVDRASDAIRHAVYAGSHPNGGAVAFAVTIRPARAPRCRRRRT